MKNSIVIVILVLLAACSNDSRDSLEQKRVINEDLIEFKRTPLDEDVDDFSNPDNKDVIPKISNDTLIGKFKLVNAGGYRFYGDVEWQNDTLTLILYNDNEELMMEEFVVEYTFKVKLNDRLPEAVRYYIEY